MDVTTVIGFIAAGLSIAAHSMRTMVPLRITGIANNFAFMTYGFLFGSLPTMILHAVLFPLNVYRLAEMLKLVKAVKAASAGDLNMDWLKPFMSKRTITKGEILFRKGDEADHMFFVVDGQLHLHEIDINVPPGAVVGELGMLAPSRTRTQTLECTESGSVLTIGYEKIEQLYYQNPTFGFYFLRLSSARLFQNIARLERLLAERDAELDRLRPPVATASTP
jgi:CRP/FNR family cyclic AMP-dependent transcriptional regulator